MISSGFATFPETVQMDSSFALLQLFITCISHKANSLHALLSKMEKKAFSKIGTKVVKFLIARRYIQLKAE